MNGKYGLDEHPTGGEYSYYSGKNRLKSVADNMGGTSASGRIMSATNNFVYDSVGNLTYDKSKEMKISYDWRGMPIEFIQQQQPTGVSGDTLFRLKDAYDYRSFGEQITMTSPSTGKVTENFTGKERVDETFYDIF